MRLRRRLLFGLAAVMGSAVVVLPAVAASEESTVEAVTGCSPYPTYPCWSPSSPITIASGGTVKFLDKSSSLEQGVRWIGSAPQCENVPSANQQGPWEGTCTFTEPGTYRFQGTWTYSSSDEVIVTAPTTTSTSTVVTPMAPTSSAPPGSSGAPPAPGSPAAGPTAAELSPLAGSASSALRLPAVQHGRSVHGSVDVSQAGVGGKLEVKLLARRASLAGAGHATQAQVGRVAHAALSAGTVSFTVALDPRAARALRLHGHLALVVRITVAPVGGSAVTIARGVLLRSQL
jgi:plastocyanin